MSVPFIFKGREFQLSTTLRVAYEVQGQHNHMPYTEIFEGLKDMTVEEQIGIVWAAFKCANSEYIKESGITSGEFMNYYLDTYNLSDLMDTLSLVIGGITGKPVDSSTNANTSVAVEGNIVPLI